MVNAQSKLPYPIVLHTPHRLQNERKHAIAPTYSSHKGNLTTVRMVPDEDPRTRNPVRTAGNSGLERVTWDRFAVEDVITNCCRSTVRQAGGIHTYQCRPAKRPIRRPPGVEYLWMQRR